LLAQMMHLKTPPDGRHAKLLMILYKVHGHGTTSKNT
jgi:hypothetical protein